MVPPRGINLDISRKTKRRRVVEYRGCIAATPGDPLAAINALDTAAYHQTLVTRRDSAASDRLTVAIRSDLHRLFATLGINLEQALQLLERRIGRDAIHAFILGTHRKLDDLTACCTAGNVYVGSLTVSEPGDK